MCVCVFVCMIYIYKTSQFKTGFFMHFIRDQQSESKFNNRRKHLS